MIILDLIGYFLQLKMDADRSWMYRRIKIDGRGLVDAYRDGVSNFMNKAIEHADDLNGKMRCPCLKCKNMIWKTADEVKFDLYSRGFVDGYSVWIHHGESVEFRELSDSTVDQSDNYDVVEMLVDAYGPTNIDWAENEHASSSADQQKPNDSAAAFYKMLSESGTPLYPEHDKHTRLSAVTKLLHYKNEHDCSERGFNDLLAIFREFLPKDNTLPASYYEVKKMVKGLNLGYEKIDACEQDCMLYYGEDKDKVQCDICNLPRYKITKRGGKEKHVSKKILRYFSLAPRLQRLFMSSHTAPSMRWHRTRDVVPGQLTHPADGDEWKNFDANFPQFADDVRNVRLGMATDGFCPFNNFSQPYSVWPVIMVAYNLPPSMCMRDPYLFLTLLIPGDKSPTKDINVYLRPLVDELKMLWETGVQTFDKSVGQNFLMKAALLWTITDFPALGMVSGWSTHGKLSCPVCMGDVQGTQLRYGRKTSFFGTARRFLPVEHSYRKMSTQFNRKTEKKGVVGRLSGSDVLGWLNDLTFPPPGKEHGKLRAIGYGKAHNWTHSPIWFELPYWGTLALRHCIDVMHTEKNVFENLFYTVLDTSGKTKDNDKSRKDLEEMNIRRELWLRPNNSKPKAPFCLTKQQVENICKWLSALKLPDGYASNISRCTKVEQLKITGFKSHDCHVFMQKLIPIAFREVLPRNINDAFTALSNFFRDICSTVIRYSDVEQMEKNIVLTMCKLEMILPPGFFDSMEHLPIHLPYELKLGGPVQYRWMYPFER